MDDDVVGYLVTVTTTAAAAAATTTIHVQPTTATQVCRSLILVLLLYLSPRVKVAVTIL